MLKQNENADDRCGRRFHRKLSRTVNTASPRKSADNQLVVRALRLSDKARAEPVPFGKNIVQPARQ